MKKQGVMDELFNLVLHKSCQCRLVILVEERGTESRYLPQKLISVQTLVMVMRKSNRAMPNKTKRTKLSICLTITVSDFDAKQQENNLL